MHSSWSSLSPPIYPILAFQTLSFYIHFCSLQSFQPPLCSAEIRPELCMSARLLRRKMERLGGVCGGVCVYIWGCGYRMATSRDRECIYGGAFGLLCASTGVEKLGARLEQCQKHQIVCCLFGLDNKVLFEGRCFTCRPCRHWSIHIQEVWKLRILFSGLMR